MQGGRDDHIDLEQLGMRSGQAQTMQLRLRPPAPVVGGEPYSYGGEVVEARVEISRTTRGFALRLRADVVLGGPCARCLEPADLALAIEAREVEQGGSEAGELSSPYVDDGYLDPTAWLHDALTLALPEKVLCREDCAGICAVCGEVLNDVEPGAHSHERPPDPRFAKLRELLDEGE